MRFSNILGSTAMVMPYSVPKYAEPEDFAISGAKVIDHHSFTTAGNNFYFFRSVKPSTEDLFAIETSVQLMVLHGTELIARLEDIKIDWLFNTTTKERFIKKEVDALDMNVEVDGDVIWCAIVCTQEETTDTNGVITSLPIDTTKDNILFTDSIGDWSVENTVITLDRLTGLITGETIAFKDFSLILRDKSTSEGV